MKTLSLVIPAYNAPDLARMAASHIPELAASATACGFELVEAIFVDDGSSDGTASILATAAAEDPRTRGGSAGRLPSRPEQARAPLPGRRKRPYARQKNHRSRSAPLCFTAQA